MDNKHFKMRELGKYSPTLKKVLQTILDKSRAEGTLITTLNKSNKPIEHKTIDQVIKSRIHEMLKYPDIVEMFENYMNECIESSIMSMLKQGFDGFTDADKEPVTNNLQAMLLTAFSPIDPYKFFLSGELEDILIFELGFNGLTLSVFRHAVREMHGSFKKVTQGEDLYKPCSVESFTAPREVYRGWG